RIRRLRVLYLVIMRERSFWVPIGSTSLGFIALILAVGFKAMWLMPFGMYLLGEAIGYMAGFLDGRRKERRYFLGFLRRELRSLAPPKSDSVLIVRRSPKGEMTAAYTQHAVTAEQVEEHARRKQSGHVADHN